MTIDERLAAIQTDLYRLVDQVEGAALRMQLMAIHARLGSVVYDTMTGTTPDTEPPAETCCGCGEPRDRDAATTWQQWECSACGSWHDRRAEEIDEA